MYSRRSLQFSNLISTSQSMLMHTSFMLQLRTESSCSEFDCATSEIKRSWKWPILSLPFIAPTLHRQVVQHETGLR